jgi:peptidoglycan LD-endopeptidase LytH
MFRRVSALGAIALLAATAVQGGASSGGAGAVESQLGIAGAATVSAIAQRVPPDGLGFPMSVTPRCDILSNFGEARSSGRAHQGIDVLSTLGQEVYAVLPGTLAVRYLDGGTDASLSGNAWLLRARTGDEYFYAHLSAFAEGLSVGSSVAQGQLIGYVGDTGNPGAGNYHLHFEVRPGGGAAIDPLSVLTVPSGCRVY